MSLNNIDRFMANLPVDCQLLNFCTLLEEQGLNYMVNKGTIPVVPGAQYTVQVDDRDQDEGKITWMKDMKETTYGGSTVKGCILYHYDIQGRFLHMAVSCV